MATGAQVYDLPKRGEDLRWYALHTRSHCEAKVADYLRALNIEVFLPDYASRRQWNDRVKVIRLPLFPGYLFSRFERRLPNEALDAPGLAHIVGFADRPAAIPEQEIESVYRLVNSGLNVLGGPMLKKGNRVRVVSGPLKGIEGRLEKIKSQYRLVISVELLCRSISAEVAPEWVEVLF